MDISYIIDIATTIIISLGGSGTIILGISNWLGKRWANKFMEKEKADYAKELESLRNDLSREIESYKIKLKKSEFIFEKEYVAASEFVSLRRSFIPTYSTPNMDRYEAYAEIAQNFSSIEDKLGAYLSKHGAILSDEIKNLISLSESIAAENKFDVVEPDAPDCAITAAEEMFTKIDKVEQLLIDQFRTQLST